MFENFHVVLTFNAVERGVDVKMSSALDESGSLRSQIENALLDLDLNRLFTLITIINIRVLQQIFDSCSDFKCIECIGVSDSFTIVLAKIGSPALIKVTLQPDRKLYLSRLRSSMKLFKGILSFEFTDGTSTGYTIPHARDKLFNLISAFSAEISEQTGHNELSEMVSFLGLKGEFNNNNSFTILSHGLPSHLQSVVLLHEGPSKFSLVFVNDVNIYTRPVDAQNLSKRLTNFVKIFWIHETLIQSGLEATISSDLTLKFSVKSEALSIEFTDGYDFVVSGPSKLDLENILNAKELEIYTFFEFFNIIP